MLLPCRFLPEERGVQFHLAGSNSNSKVHRVERGTCAVFRFFSGATGGDELGLELRERLRAVVLGLCEALREAVDLAQQLLAHRVSRPDFILLANLQAGDSFYEPALTREKFDWTVESQFTIATVFYACEYRRQQITAAL